MTCAKYAYVCVCIVNHGCHSLDTALLGFLLHATPKYAYVCVCTCICMCVFMFICMCVCMYICMYMYFISQLYYPEHALQAGTSPARNCTSCTCMYEPGRTHVCIKTHAAGWLPACSWAICICFKAHGFVSRNETNWLHVHSCLTHA